MLFRLRWYNMIDVKGSICKCSMCGKEKCFQLNWSEFRLPDKWKFRTRSLDDNNEPDEVQIACDECVK